MAHFAELDDQNVVLRVLVVRDEDTQDDRGNEDEQIGVAFLQGLFGSQTNWKQTSYNHRFRKNYAGIGFTYDAIRDAFIPPQLDPTWIFDEATCQWRDPSDSQQPI